MPSPGGSVFPCRASDTRRTTPRTRSGGAPSSRIVSSHGVPIGSSTSVHTNTPFALRSRDVTSISSVALEYTSCSSIDRRSWRRRSDGCTVGRVARMLAVAVRAATGRRGRLRLPSSNKVVIRRVDCSWLSSSANRTTSR